jgi:hypothetical protein
MGGLGSFFAAISVPIAKRVMIGLGFGVVSYAAVTAALNQALGAAKAAMAGIGGEAVSLIAMAGVNTAASIIAGALVARVAMDALKKLELR